MCVSPSLLLSWWHCEGHNYLCSIKLVSNSNPWQNLKQRLLSLPQKVLLILKLFTYPWKGTVRIQELHWKNEKLCKKNEKPAHHSSVPSLHLTEGHWICHHHGDRPAWVPYIAWCRVESPYRTRPSSTTTRQMKKWRRGWVLVWVCNFLFENWMTARKEWLSSTTQEGCTA